MRAFSWLLLRTCPQKRRNNDRHMRLLVSMRLEKSRYANWLRNIEARPCRTRRHIYLSLAERCRRCQPAASCTGVFGVVGPMAHQVLLSLSAEKTAAVLCCLHLPQSQVQVSATARSMVFKPQVVLSSAHDRKSDIFVVIRLLSWLRKSCAPACQRFLNAGSTSTRIAFVKGSLT